MKMAMLSLVVGSVIAMSPASAQTQLIGNGDFETGTFAGWTVNVRPDNEGSFLIVPNAADREAPLSGLPYEANPLGGSFFAMSDQTGSGSYALVQGFTLATAASVSFAFDLFANNYGGDTAPGRDHMVPPTQNATVDILRGGADPFTDSATDILSILYGPGADEMGGNPNPFTRYAFTRSLAAGTYQLRFAETQTQGFLNMGVDNVSVLASPVPEISTWAMMLVGLGTVGAVLRRRRPVVGTAGA